MAGCLICAAVRRARSDGMAVAAAVPADLRARTDDAFLLHSASGHGRDYVLLAVKLVCPGLVQARCTMSEPNTGKSGHFFPAESGRPAAYSCGKTDLRRSNIGPACFQKISQLCMPGCMFFHIGASCLRENIFILAVVILA